MKTKTKSTMKITQKSNFKDGPFNKTCLACKNTCKQYECVDIMWCKKFEKRDE